LRPRSRSLRPGLSTPSSRSSSLLAARQRRHDTPVRSTSASRTNDDHGYTYERRLALASERRGPCPAGGNFTSRASSRERWQSPSRTDRIRTLSSSRQNYGRAHSRSRAAGIIAGRVREGNAQAIPRCATLGAGQGAAGDARQLAHDGLSAQMARTGAPSNAVELIVVDAGDHVIHRPGTQ
jgi:hypothetical protein